jgi:ABC-type transport system substrate-binding protein
MNSTRRTDNGPNWRLSRRRVVGGGAALTALGLAGCATNPPAPAPAPAAAPAATTAPASAAPSTGAQPTAAPTAQPKYGGKLRAHVTVGRAHDDPHQQTSGNNSLSPTMAYSGLLQFKHGKDIQPGTYIPTGDLAESWEQPDELTYLFKLRPGVKFQNVKPVNGREVTSADVLYSLQRVIALKFLASLLDGVDKMETPDPRTVKVTLARPNADFLGNLAANNLAVVPKESVEVNGDLKNGPWIGTGPWIVESVTQDGNRDPVLVRNPDYFLKGLPYVDRLEFVRLADATTGIAAFRAKQLDILNPSVTAQSADEVYRSNPKEMYVLRTPQYGSSVEMAFKGSAPPFNDPRVRKAVVLAMDREAVLKDVQGGFGILTSGVLAPEPAWQLSQEELKPLYKRDVARAKQLLAEAGVPNLEFTLTVPNYGANLYVAISEYLQAQWKEVGINAQLKVVDSAAFSGTILARGDFAAYVANAGGRLTSNADLLNRYHSKGNAATTQTGYNNPKLDDLIDQQKVLGRDPAKRRQLIEQIQRTVIDDSILVGVFVSIQQLVLWNYVKDFYQNGIFTDSPSAWTDAWIDK